MAEGKTGALLGAACQLGAIASEASPDQAARYRDFGRHLGVAFQLIDDLQTLQTHAGYKPTFEREPYMPSVERHEFRFPSRGRVNPALKEAADRNIDWMLRMRLLTADQIDDYRKAKYPSLAARFFPDASPEDLQVIVDLNGISFMMDDLTESPGGIEHVTKVFEEFTRVMEAPDRTPSGVVMTAWKDLWSRLASPMSPA